MLVRYAIQLNFGQIRGNKLKENQENGKNDLIFPDIRALPTSSSICTRCTPN